MKTKNKEEMKEIVPFSSNIFIHCLGDSHVSIFNGSNTPSESSLPEIDILPNFKTHRLGPILAYSVGNKNHKSYKSLFGSLDKIGNDSYLLLSFGEIDCREHLEQQAVNQNKPINEIIETCVNVYFETVLDVRKVCKDLIVLAPHPCSWYNMEKNKIHKHFNEILEKKCKESCISFLSLFDDIINTPEYMCEYFYDGVHLKSECLVFLKDKLLEFEKKVIGD